MYAFKTHLASTRLHDDREDFGQRKGSVSIDFPSERNSLKLSCEFLGYGYDVRTDKQAFLHPAPCFARIFLFQTKGAELYAGGKSIKLKPGVLYLLPPGQSFEVAYCMKSELLYCHLHVCDQTMTPIFLGVKGIPSMDSPALAAQLLETWRAKDMLRFQLAAMDAVSGFAEKIRPAMIARASLTRKLGRLFDAIRTAEPSELRVDAMAEKCGTSRAALSKSFARAMGMPLKSYLAAIQLRAACEMLQFSSANLAEIAEKLGHSSSNYFHKFFKDRMGMTPNSYRESM